MAWRGETEVFFHGVSHKGICPLLKQWRRVGKGKASVEYLRAAVSAEPGGREES